MNRMLLSVLANLLVLVCSSWAEERTDVFNFNNLEVQKLLGVYQKLSGLELVTDLRVETVRSFTVRLQVSHPVSKLHELYPKPNP